MVLISNLVFGNILQTQAARQKSKSILEHAVNTIEDTYNNMGDDEGRFSSISFSIGENGNYIIYGSNNVIIAGGHMGERIDENFINGSRYVSDDVTFFTDLFGEKCMCITRTISGGNKLIVYLTSDEVYGERDQIVYETVLADILLFTVIYILISILVQKIVVSNLEMVNRSLNKITSGNLNEVVSVYSSSEFASLSDDINQTVDVLKTYIEAAEKRIEEELTFARSIQESALPHNFTFPRDDFEVFATMDPAKEVGGDFFDFFFIDMNKVCFVMADVSGKGIPAALFMMKSKAIIRSFAESGKSPSEIFSMTNTELCEGNLEHMFVTVWIGIADLKTGHMVCSNAGHEYPMLMRDGGDYEIYKKKHNCALAIKKNAAFAEYEIDLKPGDSVFVYTDGIPEAIDTANNAYGTDRLVNVLNRYKNLPQKDMLKYVRRDITRFVGEAEQFDDVTMLGFRYYGQSEEKPADS